MRHPRSNSCISNIFCFFVFSFWIHSLILVVIIGFKPSIWSTRGNMYFLCQCWQWHLRLKKNKLMSKKVSSHFDYIFLGDLKCIYTNIPFIRTLKLARQPLSTHISDPEKPKLSSFWQVELDSCFFKVMSYSEVII